MSIKLKQPIINGSLRATNFFNGRLVTGADMTREQASRREAVWRIGKAVGDGIVYGLEVDKDKDAGVNPIVSVTKGLAINRCGQALYVSDDTSVDLLQRFTTVAKPSKIFGDCVSNPVGTYAAGFGFYLLVLSPVESSEGSAQTSGLNNAFASCNTDVILETAQFNLIPIDAFLKNEPLPNEKLLRSYLAYRCFGYEGKNVPKISDFLKTPFGVAFNSYGLLDEMRSTSLADSEVPLAIIHWTSNGIEFVETWAVRRRITPRDDDKNWTQIVKDRRRSETEAMMMQFSEHLRRLEVTEPNLSTLKASDHFRYLPPAGIMPVSDGAQAGFTAANFFGGKATTIADLSIDLVPALLDLALSHEPINLASSQKIQLYNIKETSGITVKKSLVFARLSLPYMGQYIPTLQTFTFAPILLPPPEEPGLRWFINFNQASIPSDIRDTSKIVKGSLLLHLPQGAVIKGMTVRGIKTEASPKIFNVSLDSQTIGNSPLTLIGKIDLSKLSIGKFTASVNINEPNVVKNDKFNYIFTASWQGGANRSLTQAEIHSIQITCAV